MNSADACYRSGLYPVVLLAVLGGEGAGVVEAVGLKVKEFKPGDHVAYTDPSGSYAEILLRPLEHLVKIPAGVRDQTAAGTGDMDY